MDTRPTWQATIIGLAFLALVGAIFLVVYSHSGISDALKAWAAIGTLVGIVVGAIPTYFFGSAAAKSAQTAAGAAQKAADTVQTQLQQEQERRTDLEDRVQALTAVASPEMLAEARKLRPSLFE